MTYFLGVHTKPPYQGTEKYDLNTVSSALTSSNARTKQNTCFSFIDQLYIAFQAAVFVLDFVRFKFIVGSKLLLKRKLSPGTQFTLSVTQSPADYGDVPLGNPQA